MGSIVDQLRQIWPAATETWLWAALALVGTLVLLAVLARALFFRPFDPSALVKSVLRIAAKTLEKGPAEGAQTFGKEAGDLLRDAIGPGDKPVTDALKSEVADILWRRWRDARWSKSHKLPKAVWQDAQRLWEHRAGDIVLSIDELKAARFDPALLKQRFKEKLEAAAGRDAAGASIVSVLWPVLEVLYPTLIARPKAQAAVQLLMGQRMLELQERAAETAQRIDERTAETHSRVSDAHAAIIGVAGDLAEMKPQIIKQLDVVTGFEELPLDHVRRLPTALVVADYGIIPYDDSRGLKADLLGWALDNSNAGPAGRLYAAAGGYGKTRLALEAVTILREEHGWRTGLLPRAALEKTDIHGEQDADARLKRFFDSRGDKGALLVLDYAEGRTAQIERVTKAALASKGSPIRIMLLARGAGEWWEELHKESREIQLVYDQTPVAAIAGDIAPERRETFFNAAANAFAKQLTAAQSSDDLLLSADWEAKPISAKRLAAPEVGSPLSLAFEAFLHVRGVDPEDSPLAEMAREERRHWARALKIKASDVARIGDPRVEAVNRCAAVLTLIQGTEPASRPETDNARDKVLQVGLKDAFPPANNAENAKFYADTRSAIERLYRRSDQTGESLRPVLPDILGERIVGEALKSTPALLPSIFEHLFESAVTTFTVLNRITKPTIEGPGLHGMTEIVEPVLSATVSALEKERFVQLLSPLLQASMIEPGGIHNAAAQALELLHEPLRAVAAGSVLETASKLGISAGTTPLRLRRLMEIAARLSQSESLDIIFASMLRQKGVETEDSKHDFSLVALRASSQLYQVGRTSEALVAAQKAVAMLDELSQANQQQYDLSLAGALNNLSVIQAELGKLDHAINAAQRAIECYERVGTSLNDKHRSDFSMLLTNQATYLLRKSRLGEAREASLRSVQLLRSLADHDPSFHEPLATSLMNLASILLMSGEIQMARSAASDMLELVEGLHSDDPDAHLPMLAKSLLQNAQIHSASGEIAPALRCYERVMALLSPKTQYLTAEERSLLVRAAQNLKKIAAGNGMSAEEVDARISNLTGGSVFREIVPHPESEGGLADVNASVALARTDYADNPRLLAMNITLPLMMQAREQARRGELEQSLQAVTEAIGHFTYLSDGGEPQRLLQFVEAFCFKGMLLLTMERPSEAEVCFFNGLSAVFRSENPDFSNLVRVIYDLDKGLLKAAIRSGKTSSEASKLTQDSSGGLPPMFHVYNAWAQAGNSGDIAGAKRIYDAFLELMDNNLQDQLLDFMRDQFHAAAAEAGSAWKYGPLPMRRHSA